MEKNYDPKTVETAWYKRWEERGYFHAEAEQGGEPYCVVIPPPNVTGILHMGHALNQTIQDVLVRWRRMQGRTVLWVPGTDHAGIATQNVVEKALKKEEGKRRQEIGRDAFIERVWAWREKFGGTIVHQQRMLGNSTDWQRERFTMDEGLSRAVSKVFCDLYEKKLIYRGNYIVNWCPRCGTALADDETEHEPNAGKLWYVRYPVVGSDEALIVATTRPETLPGDTAVAVNPKDERYLHLHGKMVQLPLCNREIPIVVDDYVEKEFGTGVVKITPAHDVNDFAVGQRHNLPAVNVMHEDGTMNEESVHYAGLDRFECRKKIVEDLEKGGFLAKIEDYNNQVGHCYRCHTIVESRLSKQWFVKMAPLAKPAIQAVKDGTIRFVPQRWENIYFNWMENIRDWCISRQIWWGHRIPVYTCSSCGHEWATPDKPEKCPRCTHAAFTQDPDVLDTWFSSWLWPFTTLGWPEKTADLKFYYPTTDLVTAPDIIFFWVARMIMAGYEFMGEAPFKNIVIHGIVRDDKGRKMSKSLGNSLDPLEIIDQYSADALRFSLALITSLETDSRVNMSKFEIGRNFATKLWNAARFIKMHADKLDGFAFRDFAGENLTLDPALLHTDDQHLLFTCDQTCAKMADFLEKYRIQDGALTIYDFVWTNVCDWYLEYAKSDLNAEDVARRRHVLSILADVFGKSLKLLHPYMPFVTEEIWHQLGYCSEDETIMATRYPTGYTAEQKAAWSLTEDVMNYVNAKREMITAGRALRAEYGIAPSKFVKYIIQLKEAEVADRLTLEQDTVMQLLRSDNLEIVVGADEKAMPGTLCKFGMIYLPLEGLIDMQAEATRIKTELDKLRGFLAGVCAKLSNESFVSKAPAAVIDQQRAKQKELEESIGKLEKLYTNFTR